MPYVRGSVRLGPKGIRVTKGYYRSPRGSGAAGVLLVAGLFVLGLILVVLKALFDFVVAFIVPISVAAGVALAIFGFIRLKRARLENETSALLTTINDSVSSMTTDESVWKRLQEQIDTLRVKNEGLQKELYDIYQALVVRVARDGKVTETERSILAFVEKTFSVSPSDAGQLKREGFLSYLGIAVLDNKLTVQEEANLNHLIKELDVDMGQLGEQASLITELVECRKISEGELSEVTTSFPLKEAEKCYMDSKANEIVRKKKAGDYFYEPGESGSIIITNRQVIFKAGSAIVVPLKSIVEARVDTAENRLEIVKSGRLTPYCFRLECPRKACTLIEKLASSNR